MIGVWERPADLPAHLVPVDAGKHQVQEDEVRVIQVKSSQRLLPVVHDHCVKTFFCQIQGDELRDVLIIIYDQYFLLVYHKILP